MEVPSISESFESSTTETEEHTQSLVADEAIASVNECSVTTAETTPTLNEQSSSTTVEEDDTEFRAYCKQLLLLLNGQPKQTAAEIVHNSTYTTIPLFYHKLPKNSDCMAQKLREEARTLFLQKRSKELLDNNELKVLWGLLEKNYTVPLINGEQFISYDDYLKVVRLAGEKCK